MSDFYMKKLIIVIFISVIILITPILVLANGAKPIENPIDQTILFDKSSGVQLVEETVKFTFEEDKYYRAKVEIEYNLTNLTDEEQNFNILFVTPSLEDADFKVTINDKVVENIVTKQKITVPKNWTVRVDKKIVEPTSKKTLDKSFNRHSSKLNNNFISGATFPVSIKGHELVKLNITYNSEGGFYRYGDVINTVYSQLYYLTPAKFWDGETKVNLRIQFPENSNLKVFSNISMNKINDYIYEGTLDEIPDKEWLFSFTEKSSLIFGTNSRLKHNIYLIAIALMLSIISIRMKSKSNKRYIRYALYLLIIASILNIKLPYSAMFFFMIFIVCNPLFYLFLLFILIFKLRKPNKL